MLKSLRLEVRCVLKSLRLEVRCVLESLRLEVRCVLKSLRLERRRRNMIFFKIICLCLVNLDVYIRVIGRERCAENSYVGGERHAEKS